MKNLALLACLTFFCNLFMAAQVPKAMPPDADEFYNQSMPQLRPRLKDFILKNAKAMEHCKMNPDSLSAAFHKASLLKGMSNTDIEGLIVLTMVQASKNADADLKKMVLEIGQKREAAKEKNIAVSDEQNIQLQNILDRKSDMAEQVSYTMKKISGSQQSIISNLK
ncbi:MAG TPA: hypothetical protein VG847_10460 [Chitinophagaceae bacterium]|nr:hypothetical protein [Chitinophagaceae bacterium]